MDINIYAVFLLAMCNTTMKVIFLNLNLYNDSVKTLLILVDCASESNIAILR